MVDVDFGYRSPIKSIAKHCAYTGEEFTKKKKATFEHIVPHSMNGKNDISNMLATTSDSNSRRGNMPFDLWIKQNPEVAVNIQNYLKEMRKLESGKINYVEVVKPTLNKEARGVVTFYGNIGNRLNYTV